MAAHNSQGSDHNHQPRMMTLSDTYFYEELCASLDQSQATVWLTSTSTKAKAKWDRTTAVQRPASCPATTISQIMEQNHQSFGSNLTTSLNVDELDISELARKLGVSPGLIYTDAAHILLDAELTAPRECKKLGHRKRKSSSICGSFGYVSRSVRDA
jgi:hypothetical protein